MKCQRRTDVSYGNPIVAKKEHSRIHGLHRQRIANMRPSIDTSCPPSQPHLTTFGRDYFWKKKTTVEAAFSDLKMIQSIARTMTRPYDMPLNKGPTSLNSTYRKQELFRITMDNHRLLNRLENGVQPVYSVKRLDENHRQNRQYMVNSSYSARKGGAYLNKSQSTPNIRRSRLKMIADQPPSNEEEPRKGEPAFHTQVSDQDAYSDGFEDAEKEEVSYGEDDDFEVEEDAQPPSDTKDGDKVSLDIDVEPSKNVDVEPSKNVAVEPSKNVAVEPSKNVDVEPSKNVDVEPSKNVDVEPSKNVDVAPSKDLDVAPSKDLDVEQSKNLDVEPSKDLDVEDLHVEQSENLDIAPSKDLDADSSKNRDFASKAPSVEGTEEVTELDKPSKALDVDDGSAQNNDDAESYADDDFEQEDPEENADDVQIDQAFEVVENEKPVAAVSPPVIASQEETYDTAPVIPDANEAAQIVASGAGEPEPIGEREADDTVPPVTSEAIEAHTVASETGEPERIEAEANEPVPLVTSEAVEAAHSAASETGDFEPIAEGEADKAVPSVTSEALGAHPLASEVGEPEQIEAEADQPVPLVTSNTVEAAQPVASETGEFESIAEADADERVPLVTSEAVEAAQPVASETSEFEPIAEAEADEAVPSVTSEAIEAHVLASEVGETEQIEAEANEPVPLATPEAVEAATGEPEPIVERADEPVPLFSSEAIETAQLVASETDEQADESEQPVLSTADKTAQPAAEIGGVAQSVASETGDLSPVAIESAASGNSQPEPTPVADATAAQLIADVTHADDSEYEIDDFEVDSDEA